MTPQEFLSKAKNLAVMYGYSQSPYCNKNSDYGFDLAIQFERKTPSRLSVNLVKPYQSTDIIGIYINYCSVVFNYTPTGNVSITSKEHIKYIEKQNIDKFNWDVFEKWLKTQAGVKQLYTESIKEKKIKKTIKRNE